MPYNKPSELPPKVKDHLPAGAQKIYMEAFNHAWEQYKSSQKRTRGGDREAVAHRVAWAAVKKKYKKGEDNDWHKL
jgi:cation transport regulator